MAAFSPVPLTGWSIIVTQDIGDMYAEARGIKTILISVTAVFLVLTCIVVVFFGRGIARPLMKIAADIDGAANHVASASNEVSTASQSLAGGMSQQASALEESSASLDQMASMTRQNADNAVQAKALMDDTKRIVGQVAKLMDDISGTMGDITAASNEQVQGVSQVPRRLRKWTRSPSRRRPPPKRWRRPRRR